MKVLIDSLKLIKRRFFLLLLSFVIFSLQSVGQTVIEMTHPTDADIVLLKVDKKSDADIIVFKTKKKKEARQWDCLWKFKNWGFANLSIFIMDNINDTAKYNDDDISFAVDGKVYFTENKDERGYNNPNFRLKGVFRKFREAPQDNNIDTSQKVTQLSYFVTIDGNFILSDNKSEIPKGLKISIVDSAMINTFNTYNPESLKFTYKQQLDIGKYNILVTSDEYRQYVEPFSVTGNDSLFDLKLNVTLNPNVIKRQEVLIVNNLFFDFDSFKLTEESTKVLDKMISVMQENPVMKLELTGYTDSKGSKTYNEKLSRLRSKSAVNYLKEKGISAERMISYGKGEKSPIALNKMNDGSDCKEGRKYNRRVQIKFVNEDQTKVKIEEIVIPDNLKVKDNQSK
ncbi:MAG: OmpA family protein [Bacteroidia bacterium]|nr:OmpA family protein [Bacteroidia bacterium]